MLFDILRNTILAGIGIQESVKKMIDELVKQGELSSSQGATLLKEWSKKTTNKSSEVASGITEMMGKALDKMNLPTKDDVEKLHLKINALSTRVSRLEEDKQSKL